MQTFSSLVSMSVNFNQTPHPNRQTTAEWNKKDVHYIIIISIR